MYVPSSKATHIGGSLYHHLLDGQACAISLAKIRPDSQRLARGRRRQIAALLVADPVEHMARFTLSIRRLIGVATLAIAMAAGRAGATPFAYVGAGGGNIGVIDTATDAIVATVSIG